MIEFKNVTKSYGDGTVALRGIDLNVKKGELLTLIGPSGCGKTTTMRMVNRLTEPTSGEILIDGKDISTLDPVELRRNTGYIIQEIGLFPHMTIEQNIGIVPRLRKDDPKVYSKRVDELLELVGLDPETFKPRTPSELSGGQQQRIGVIRALAADPDIILMDEPFSALDPISRERLQEDIVALQEEIQKTIVFVTHDMDEAIKIADRIAIMQDGEIIQLDTPEQILRHPKNDFVKGFIGEERLFSKSGGLPTAKDMLKKDVITISPGRGLAEAMYRLRQRRVDSLFVTKKDNTFVGIAQYNDIDKSYQDEALKVSDVVIAENLKILKPDDVVTDIAEIFDHTKLNAIPVVDDQDKLLGIVTRTTMIRGLANWRQGGDE